MVSLKLSEIVEVAASRPSPGLVPCVLKAAPAQLSPGLLMPPKLLGEEVAPSLSALVGVQEEEATPRTSCPSGTCNSVIVWPGVGKSRVQIPALPFTG